MPILQAMKAAAVIEQYKNRRRDFQGESLRGGNFRGIAGHDAVIAGESRRLLRDYAKAHSMVVAPGDDGGAGWGTESR